jgi:hypothetical protein
MFVDFLILKYLYEIFVLKLYNILFISDFLSQIYEYL